MNESSRLDRAMAVLRLRAERRPVADCWHMISTQLLDGLELTGASPEVREAIESCAGQCNAILAAYGDQSSDSPSELEPADIEELVQLSYELAECIRDAESERILARFRHHGGVLPVAEIIEARRHREWFTALMLREFQAIVDASSAEVQDSASQDAPPMSGESKRPKGEKAARSKDSLSFFALFLFSEWNAAESVPVILKALALPNDALLDMLGDALYEQIPRYIAQFFANEPDRIDDLIRDANRDPTVRWSVACSYKFLVRDGAITLDDAVGRLDRLFHDAKVIDDDGGPAPAHPYEVTSGIISVIDELGGATRSTIADTEQEWDFVDQFLLGREDFYAAARGQAAIDRLPSTAIDDCIEELKHWGVFQPKPPRSSLPGKANATRRIDQASKAAGKPKGSSRSTQKTSRNAPCPCGSGKKFKQCCLRSAKEFQF